MVRLAIKKNRFKTLKSLIIIFFLIPKNLKNELFLLCSNNDKHTIHRHRKNFVPRKKVIASEVSCTDKACRVQKENLDQCAIKTEKN